jgi:carboxymethylenebutenolidase
MKRCLLLLLIFAMAGSALAATSTDVSYKSGDETVKAVMYTPAGKGRLPALIVIHEFWGLVPWVKEQASQLADQGYVTLAIDLYRGHATTSADEAHELMRGVPQDRAARDLRAAYAYLAGLKNVDPKRIGAIGWCMGGGYALDVAINEPRLAADVINYGRLATERSTLEKIHAPILGLFGAQDRGIPVDSVRAFEKQMAALGRTADIVVYPDAGHAFENPNNKAGYRAADAKDAWDKTVAFLAKYLKK